MSDFDFMKKKTVTSSTSWIIKTLSENIVLIDIASVLIIPVLFGIINLLWIPWGFGII